MPDVDLVVVGCGPAGGIAAREAARSGVQTVVLERDAVVGARRVCAAGLRPGFCEQFDVPAAIVHCETPHVGLISPSGRRYDFEVGAARTTTREELDGTIAQLARGEGVDIRTSALFRGVTTSSDAATVEYADGQTGRRRHISARRVFFAQGSTARLDEGPFGYDGWPRGLITCFQYRLFPSRPAVPVAYRTLEMHYYVSGSRRNVIAWMFPKRDHLAIGLGVMGKIAGSELRAELDEFVRKLQRRLFPDVAYTIREEGNLLYGGKPRPTIASGQLLLGGTAAGLVDATTGEGIHEAAASGRFAAEAVVAEKKGKTASAAVHYRRATTRAFYGRLRHRHKLMTFLERRPVRFDILFEQLESTPRFAKLLQHDRHDFTLPQWLYLYAQAARFGLRASVAR
ncbi:MAG: NAD(P)/FAD-dependent oxidoreductase [Candidatus Eremiobacteraeota bacterium]|nr:NAD(P)/FAD-dependent oxidoreductase [Candidatus Eremiobacteraeota bacterium]